MRTKLLFSFVVLGLVWAALPTSAHADNIAFTCTECTNGAPTATLASSGDVTLTWVPGSIASADLGDVAADAGFTSLSIPYTGDWGCLTPTASNDGWCDISNEGNTYFILYDDNDEFADGDYPLAVCLGLAPTCGWTDYGTYTVTTGNSTSVPEPAVLSLLFSGLLGLGLLVGLKRHRGTRLAATA